MDKKYHAKLMLAGEYAAIVGGEALTVPLRQFSAQLNSRKQAANPEMADQSIFYLRKLYEYLKIIPENSFNASSNLSKFNDLLNNKYYVESSIPMEYGIGSSAAISALVYDQFFEKPTPLSLQQQQDDLAVIESFFHGKSSGVDALSSYLDQAVHFTSKGPELIHDSDPLNPGTGYRFFLVDSGVTYKTAPLVEHFNLLMNDAGFSNVINNDLLPLNSKFIASLLKKSNTDPAPIFSAISDLQWKYFRKMIPDSMQELWIQGMATNIYSMKLNGSGGGFMLGITHEDSMEYISELMQDHQLIIL